MYYSDNTGYYALTRWYWFHGMDDFTCCVLRHTACWSCFSFLPASLLTRPRLETVDPSDIFWGGRGGRGDDINVQLTFAILPRCIPGETKERREEDKCSGHSSISEPHLISAMPLLGWVSGTPELPLPPSLPPSLPLSLWLQDVETGVGTGIGRFNP